MLTAYPKIQDCQGELELTEVSLGDDGCNA